MPTSFSPFFFFRNSENANFLRGNLREGGIWPSSYLGEWESGTAIPVSNRPFGPKLWKAEERASKPFLYQPTAPPNWYQIFRKIIWASARSSSLSNWRVCWLWSFHRVSKVAPKGGHNLRPPHGERESTRKLGSKKLVHKIFLLRKWRENGVECPPSKGSFEGWLESPELAIAVIDSLCPRLSNGPIPSFIRFFPQKKAFF